MSEQLPTHAIQLAPPPATETWFEYPVRVQPNDTDYSGAAWHGAYIAWMEEARVEYLRSIGVNFADLVALGCDLPVVELALRYHRAIQMGMEAIVKARMLPLDGVRINWDYRIVSLDEQELYVTAQVTLVAVDREKGKILRRLPAAVHEALMRLVT